jgi:gliding motility-associated-like protein
MNKNILTTFLFLIAFSLFSQKKNTTPNSQLVNPLKQYEEYWKQKLKMLEITASDSLDGLDEQVLKSEATAHNFFGPEYYCFLWRVKRHYIDQKYKLHENSFFNNAKQINNGNIVASPNATPCVNEDFEASPAVPFPTVGVPTGGTPMTSVAGWTVQQSQSGFFFSSVYYNTCSVSLLPAAAFTLAVTETWVRQTPIVDPNFPGGVPHSPLGGTKVIQLNDHLSNWGEMSRIAQTFPVTSNNALFQFAYAASFDGSGHSCCDQPFLRISLKNCSGTPLSCPNVSIVASGPYCTTGTPGFSNVTTGVTGYGTAASNSTWTATMYSKNWTIQAIDLTPYIGSCVTIEVTVGDCTGWAHAGYCYFDAKCSPMTLVVNNQPFPAGTVASTVAACGAASGTMIAPAGMGPYSWTGPPGSGITANPSQTIITSFGGTYTLTMNPPGACAPITKFVTLVFPPNPSATFSLANSCNVYTLTNTGTGPPAVQTWSFAGPSAPPSFTTTNVNSTVTFTATGNHTITHIVTNTAGCSATVTQVVNVPAAQNPAFSINTPTQCLTGNSFNFNAVTPTGTHSYTFNPTVGAPAAGSSANYTGSFTQPGTYTVVHSITSGGCTATTSSVVVVNPMPAITTNFTNAVCGNPNGVIVINNVSGPGQTITGFSVNGTSVPSQTVINLAAGSYTVSAVNNFGCPTSTVVTIGNVPGITAAAHTQTNASCGNSNGIIQMGVITGGTPTYSYSINNGPFVTSTTFSNLAAGTYTIVVKDVNNCLFTKTVSITNTPPITNLNFTTTPSNCTGNTGVFGVTSVVGGSAPFTFTVNGSPSGSVVTGLAQGTHTVIVKDNFGCTYTTNFNIGLVSGPNAATVITSAASCGNANGSATVTAVSGGAAPYQYSFNGGPFSSNNFVSGQTAGPKNVVIMDNNGCTYTVNFTIGNTGSPVSSVSNFSNVSCNGGNNGSFTLTTAGGVGPYTYTLQPGNVTSGFGFFTGLTAQTYTVTVKDNVGCITTVTVNISQPAPLSLTVNMTPPLCNGGNNGSITGNASGGTAPYQYNVNGGPYQASNTFTGYAAGTYIFGVQDNKGCTTTQSIQVTQPPAITLALNSSNATCSDPNGSATVNVSGGTPIYTYTWSPLGGNSFTAGNLTAGIYSVTVMDANNCTQTGVVTVNATVGGTAIISTVNHVSCNGLNNGNATAGGVGFLTPPLSYSWSNGQTTQMASNLAPGTYTVWVYDASGCNSSTVVTITQPAPLNYAINSNSVLCFNGNSGSATVTSLTGGTGPYQYLWSPGGFTTSSAIGLTAGLYSVTVTDSKGCVLAKTVNITQPTSVTINASTITANCNQANGSASVVAVGGIAPYTYSWSTGATGQVLNNVVAGTYTINVTDNNNCVYTSAVTIPNAAGPVVSVISQTNVSCHGGNNGAAVVQVSGGTTAPGFPIYQWSNGQNAGTATNLQAGVHTVTVTDAAGCVASTSVNITQPPALTLNVSGSNPLCFGATNGSANAGVLGGTPAYSFSWTPTPGSGGNTSSPTNMGAGVYFVTVTDNNGCIINGSVQLNNPPQLLASVSATNVSCYNQCNGAALGSATNAAGAVSYYYVGGSTPIATQLATNLCAGAYTMTATDQNNCQATVIFTITQPPLLTVSLTAVGNVSCSGGSNGFASIGAGGGTPAYSYSWSNGQTVSTATGLVAGSYQFTVTDAMNCTASGSVTITQPSGLTATVTGTNVTCFGLNNGLGNVAFSGGTGLPNILWLPSLNTSQLATNLAPGIHTVQLTDANGCQISQTLNITQPPQLTATIQNVVPTNCNMSNGSASVAVSGGAGGYSYLWSGSPSYTNAGITNISAGAYTVIVTDMNGCNVSAIANVPNIAGPTISNTYSTHVSCFGGTNGAATVVATALTPPITYLWSFGAQTTSVVTNLPAGLHSITVFDGAGCIATASIQINEPPQLVSAIGSQSNVTCNGAGNGGATILVNGGTPAYNYSWTPSGQTSSVLTSASPGVYTCVVTDNNGCIISSTVSITQPNPILITTNTIVNISCFGGNNGQINTFISGGSAPYTYSWQSSSTVVPGNNPIATNLVAGTYTLNVTDINGCSTQSVYLLTQPTAISVLSSFTAPATCGNANGSSTVNITGGTTPYQFQWNTPNPQNTNIATGLSGGVWNLNVTDANGCTFTASVTIPAPALPTMTMTATAPLCFGQTTGSSTVSVTGNGPFSYQWSPAVSTASVATNLGAGIYNATVTDVYGCSVYSLIQINQPPVLNLNVSPVQNICYGQFAQVYANAGGGTPPYTYTWTSPNNEITSNTGGPHNVTPTVSGQYVVSVVDANGCVNGPQTAFVNVSQPLSAAGYMVEKCHGGQVVLTPLIVSPGNGGPYTYLWNNGSSASQLTVTANYNSTPNIYSVTVSDGCTSPNTTAIFTIDVKPTPVFSFSHTPVKGCAPLPVWFFAISSDNSVQFTWNFGGEDMTFTGQYANPVFPQPGSYNLILSAQNQYGCRKDTALLNYIQVYPTPTAAFYPDPPSTTLMDPVIYFHNQSIGAISYFWDFGDYTSSNNTSYLVNPNHEYQYVGDYTVHLVAINGQGCKDTAVHIIRIEQDVMVYIPNAFTPDGNGKNDTFFPKGYGIREDGYKMEIFDRWGELIFTSDKLTVGWDGRVKGTQTIAQEGVYIYKIMVTTLEGDKKYFTGHVTLLKQ